MIPQPILVPQDRISERICEQIVDELIKLSSAERISKRTAEQIVDAVSQIQDKIAEVTKPTPQGRFSERTVVQTEVVPVPQILKEVVEVVKAVKTVPQERISAKICEQIVDAHVPQAVDAPVPSFPSFQEEIDEMIKLFSEEHTPRRIIQGFTPQERISERTNEQTVDKSGDQARRDTADSLHRQSCRHAGGDAVPGPSYSDGEQSVDQPGDQARRVPTDFIHRQGCRHAGGDEVAGPSNSDGIEDHGSPVPINLATKHAEFPQT